MSHTKEPWESDGVFVLSGYNMIVSAEDSDFDVECSDANAYRIVACVNACAGMDDPAAEIARLQAEDHPGPHEKELVLAALRAELAALKAERDGLREAQYMADIEKMGRTIAATEDSILADKYRALATPEIYDFLSAVEREALHQRDRWGVEHDAGKADSDWFWLIGFLAGKALHKPEKLLHHIIATAAACLNWHAAKVGAHNAMRPGIADPYVAALESSK